MPMRLGRQQRQSRRAGFARTHATRSLTRSWAATRRRVWAGAAQPAKEESAALPARGAMWD